MKARRAISAQYLPNVAGYWSNLILKNDPKRFWNKNNIRRNNIQTPHIKQCEESFEYTYKWNNEDDLHEMLQLESNVYTPVLDDSITEFDVTSAYKDLKKSGYDYALPIINILISSFSLTLLMLMSFMFYVSYPFSLSLSLLSLIPKTGNLALPTNYRGVQMMNSSASLFDRIITNRLKLWPNFNIDQTAFQKGKSTLLHILNVRILIEVAKKKHITLYIGSKWIFRRPLIGFQG